MADSNGNGEVDVENLNQDLEPALDENGGENNGDSELVNVFFYKIVEDSNQL